MIDIATSLSKEVVPTYTINLNVVFRMYSVNAVEIGPDSLFNYYCDSTLHSTQVIPSHSGVCDLNPLSVLASWMIVESLLDSPEP